MRATCSTHLILLDLNRLMGLIFFFKFRHQIEIISRYSRIPTFVISNIQNIHTQMITPSVDFKAKFATPPISWCSSVCYSVIGF